MIATNTSDQKNIGLEKQQKNTTYNAFYASKLQDHVDRGLLFENIWKLKITDADPDHLFSAIA